MISWRIAAWKNTEFRIHPAVPIFFAYSALTGHLRFAAVATLSILLHECAHAGAAVLSGQPLRSIELTPLGAVLKTDNQDDLPSRKRIFILAAGPIASWLISCLTIALLMRHMLPQLWGRLLFTSNLSILLMNLIPAYPLDGGRLLALLLEQFIPQHLVCRIMRSIGTAIGVALIALNIFCTWKLGGWNLSLALAGCCMIRCAHTETTTWKMTEFRYFLDRKIMLERKKHLPVSVKYVLGSVQITELIRNLPPHKMMLFFCIEPGTMKVLGCITEMEVIQQYLKGSASTLKQVVKMSENCALPSKYDTI